MNKRLILLIVSMILSLVSCASIVSGSTQDIIIWSSPDDADVVIYDKHGLKVWDSSTPALVNLKRGDGYFSSASYRVEIIKDGYEKQVIPISSSLNWGWYLIGNLGFGGFIGMLIIDPITGAMWALEPENVGAELRQHLTFDNNENVAGIYVVLKEQIANDIFDTLELVKIN